MHPFPSLVQGRGEKEQDAVEKRDTRKADAQESLVGGIVSGIVGWLNENSTARTVFANASLTVSTAYDITVRSAGGAFSKRKIDDAKDAAIAAAERGKAANEAAGQAEIDRLNARALTEDWYEPSDTMLVMMESEAQRLEERLASIKQGYLDQNGIPALKSWVAEVDASGVLNPPNPTGPNPDPNNPNPNPNPTGAPQGAGGGSTTSSQNGVGANGSSNGSSPGGSGATSDPWQDWLTQVNGRLDALANGTIAPDTTTTPTTSSPAPAAGATAPGSTTPGSTTPGSTTPGSTTPGTTGTGQSTTSGTTTGTTPAKPKINDFLPQDIRDLIELKRLGGSVSWTPAQLAIMKSASQKHAQALQQYNAQTTGQQVQGDPSMLGAALANSGTGFQAAGNATLDTAGGIISLGFWDPPDVFGGTNNPGYNGSYMIFRVMTETGASLGTGALSVTSRAGRVVFAIDMAGNASSMGRGGYSIATEGANFGNVLEAGGGALGLGLGVVGKTLSKADAKLPKDTDVDNAVADVVTTAEKADETLKPAAEKLAKASNQLKVLNGTCFAAGTPILTPHGSRPIEALQIGELVYCRPELLPDAELRARKVTKVMERHAPLWEIELGGRVIETTSEHPFFVEERGWLPGSQLRVGDRVVGHDGKTTAIDRIAETDRGATVYNITVEEDHTYFVGGEDWGFSVWVHNEYKVSELPDGTFRVLDDAGKPTLKLDADGLPIKDANGNAIEEVFSTADAANAKLAELNKARNAGQPVAELSAKADHAVPAARKALTTTPGGRNLSNHAANESLTRHGFKAPFAEIDDIINQAQWAVKQTDGATVFINKMAGRGRSYRVVVQSADGTIVTGLKNLTPHELRNLAQNNGFQLPW
jgi:hypothetical protein